MATIPPPFRSEHAQFGLPVSYGRQHFYNMHITCHEARRLRNLKSISIE